jgi:hypothetical protein
MAAAGLLCGAGASARECRRQKTSAQQVSVIPTEFSSFRPTSYHSEQLLVILNEFLSFEPVLVIPNQLLSFLTK